ncbi:transposition helper protein, fragment, partial [Aromatoleum aromaticum EbN1]
NQPRPRAPGPNRQGSTYRTGFPVQTIGATSLMGDHVHMCLSIPPKYAVSNVVGYLKGKSAIQIARRFGGRQKNFTGENFWARGYFVSTVGLDEAIVRAYIRAQEEEDERYDQMRLPTIRRLHADRPTRDRRRRQYARVFTGAGALRVRPGRSDPHARHRLQTSAEESADRHRGQARCAVR